MTNEFDPAATPQSDVLLKELRELKKASPFKKGEQAVHLAAITIVVIRALELRINQLEDAANAS